MTRKVVNFCTRVGFFLKVSKISNFIGTRVHLALARKQSLREQPATTKKNSQRHGSLSKIVYPHPNTLFFGKPVLTLQLFFGRGRFSGRHYIFYIFPSKVSTCSNFYKRKLPEPDITQSKLFFPAE